MTTFELNLLQTLVLATALHFEKAAGARLPGPDPHQPGRGPD